MDYNIKRFQNSDFPYEKQAINDDDVIFKLLFQQT